MGQTSDGAGPEVPLGAPDHCDHTVSGKNGRKGGVMPDRLQAVADSVGVVPLVGVAAVTAVLDAIFGGLTSVLGVAVAALWAMDMVGGMLRSLLTQGVESISLEKFARGLAKALAVGMGVVLCGILELLQHEVIGVTAVPFVSPLLVGAVGLFAWSILGQVVALWPDFGEHLGKMLDRWQSTREHTEEGA